MRHQAHDSAGQSLSAPVARFLEDHSIRHSPLVARAETPIRLVTTSLGLLEQCWANHADRLVPEPTSGILLNLLHRNYEQVEGALVGLVTGCGPMAEVAARAAMELSATVLYILIGDKNRRVLAYFRAYVTQTRKEISKWRDAASAIADAGDRQVHLKAVEYRGQFVSALQNTIEDLHEQFGVARDEATESWPGAVLSRFEAIGQVTSYRTFYTRLSSSVHGDAEETLRYLIGKASGDEAILRQMGAETVEFCRYVVFESAAMYMLATSAYAYAFHCHSEADRLRKGMAEIRDQMELFADRIGAPPL
jgi:hypothetical protein